MKRKCVRTHTGHKPLRTDATTSCNSDAQAGTLLGGSFASLSKNKQANILRDIKKIITTRAGDDRDGFVSGLLKSRWGVQIRGNYSKDRLRPFVQPVLNKYVNSNNREKSMWLSLLSHSLSLIELRQLAPETTITDKAYTRSRNHIKKYGILSPIPMPPCPPKKKKLTQEDITMIHIFCESEDYSRACPNQSVKVKEGNQWVEFGLRVWTTSLNNVWLSFLSTHSSSLNISYSTFLRYRPHHIKSPCRKTDMCDICMRG